MKTALWMPLAVALAAAENWLGESAQGDKWIFCLTAARIAAHQERT
jgi:hypothetical protein